MVFQNKGFTLIELIVSVVVVSVVAVMAISSFQEIIRNNRSVTIANEFIDAVSFARAQAVSRPARISICASDDGATCGSDWGEGYIVFVDTATTDTAESPETPEDGGVLKVILATRDDIEMVAAFGESETNFIRFTSMGTLARISSDPLTVKTKITNCKGDSARVINITLAGQTTALPQDCDTPF